MKEDFDVEFVIQLLEERITKIELAIKELNRFQDITHCQYQKTIKRKHPYKCPVCDGKSKVQVTHGLLEPFEKRIVDSQGRHYILCDTCEGKGIVWG